MNSEFSFSQIGCCIKMKEPSAQLFHYNLEKRWIHAFLKGICKSEIQTALCQVHILWQQQLCYTHLCICWWFPFFSFVSLSPSIHEHFSLHFFKFLFCFSFLPFPYLFITFLYFVKYLSLSCLIIFLLSQLFSVLLALFSLLVFLIAFFLVPLQSNPSFYFYFFALLFLCFDIVLFTLFYFLSNFIFLASDLNDV